MIILKALKVAIWLLILPVCVFAQVKYQQSTLLGFAEDSGAGIFDIDNAGNAYVVMSSRYDINFGGKLFDRHAASDYSVVGKLNAAGKVMWSRTLSAVTGFDQIYDLKVDKNENVYISGAGGGITLDDGTVLQSGLFLIKLDKNGKTSWGIISDGYRDPEITGPLALAPDGVFWSAIFYDNLKIQGYSINAFYPNTTTPEGIVAKVTSAGKITAVYHDPARGSIPQIMVSSNNGLATVIMSRGGIPKNQVVLDANCQVVSDKPWLIYGDFPLPVRAAGSGYQMLTNIYNDTPNGLAYNGFYDYSFDDKLNTISATRVFADKENLGLIYGTLKFNDQYFITLPKTCCFGYNFDWFLADGKGNYNLLPDDNIGAFGDDPITRTYVKMVGDTLNMLVRHLSYYTTDYTFNGKHYSTPSNLDESYFWCKYLYDDADSCKKVHASVLKNGIEGSQDVILHLALPRSCPAGEDIAVKLSQKDPSLNQNDFVLPATAVIKKGDTSTNVTVKVINDEVVENTETFTANLDIGANAAGYKLATGSTTRDFTIADDDNTPANRIYTISYTPQITEGASGLITVSLPAGTLLSVPLSFNFLPLADPFAALPGADYTPIAITIPAGQNSVQFKVDAKTDNLIEGDEFINGLLSPVLNDLGTFTTANDAIRIKINDLNNTVANRVILVTPVTDTLKEGGNIAYGFNLLQPNKLVRQLPVQTVQTRWFTPLQQSQNDILIDTPSVAASFNITYPDDNIISKNRRVKLTLTANDAHTGSFQFLWKGQLTDSLSVVAVDNDQDYKYLEISPLSLTIPEGKSADVTLQIPGGRYFEYDIAIAYKWGGTDISTDQRIIMPQGSVTIPVGQNKISINMPVADDQKINEFNDRLIEFNAIAGSDGSTVAISPQNTVAVKIIDDDLGVLKIPNIFTPNGDGANDTWVIPNLSFDAQCKVTVYNRFGAIVFNSIGYANPWDGKTNSGSVPAATYYYIINSRGKKFSGNVTVLR
ncbi:T9SS type B sorting domain-containing protein [Mucilaginibacter ginsenosidivorax]|uniref:T9SS type B sorting domain-containing protein n=1 Tax=Mucilaginibacter ginsenosidivorax TaxID=862126 RepID=A0A5B8VTG0_9SPHI|nr:gliding motility-associated C-terminal domain-containing protein [Mucilaginibacter ginsenosidivorax]QEC74887.1 T9SS type B sorting domain-containing protein [Mucilaginibacter ginsenosidivorax]